MPEVMRWSWGWDSYLNPWVFPNRRLMLDKLFCIFLPRELFREFYEIVFLDHIDFEDCNFKFFAFRNEDTCLPVFYNTASIFGVICDHRKSWCHGFQIDQSKSICFWWKYKNIDTSINFRKFYCCFLSDKKDIRKEFLIFFEKWPISCYYFDIVALDREEVIDIFLDSDTPDEEKNRWF